MRKLIELGVKMRRAIPLLIAIVLIVLLVATVFADEPVEVERTFSICIGKDFNANGKLDEGEPLINGWFQGAILFNYSFLKDFIIPSDFETNPYYYTVFDNGSTAFGYCFDITFDDIDPELDYRYWIVGGFPDGCHPTTPVQQKGPFGEDTELFFGCRSQTETQYIPTAIAQ